jgi:LmbE family N-acetylglucosaminyl deacetylase
MKTALLFTAHADDAEFFAGGAVLKLLDEGWVVREVIATDNGKGSYELDSPTLVSQSRDREARAVALTMGKASVDFLGYPDGDLGAVSPLELRGRLMGFLREYRPQLVLTFDPFANFEGHPDHRAVAWAASEAVGFGALPLYHPEHRERGLLPHLAPERLYFAKNPANFNHFVDIGAVIGRKIDALLLHDSQMKLTIDDLRLSIEATGEHVELLPLLDRANPRPVLELLIHAWARRIAGLANRPGLELAEGFRRETAADLLS